MWCIKFFGAICYSCRFFLSLFVRCNNIFYMHFDGAFIFHPPCNCIVNLQCTHYNVMNLFVCCSYTFQTWLSWRRILWRCVNVNKKKTTTKNWWKREMCHQKLHTTLYTHTHIRQSKMRNVANKETEFRFWFGSHKIPHWQISQECMYVCKQKVNVWLELSTSVRMKESIKRLNNAQDCNK